MSDLRLHGILPAVVTPFMPDGSVDEEGLRSYLGWLKNQGVHALVVHADSGEGHALSPGERDQITGIAAQVADGDIPVISGLIAQSTEDAIHLGRRASDAGADALMVFSPISFLGAQLPPEMPKRYFAAIADGTGLPLVAFQLQAALGGAEYSNEALDQILQVEAVVAVKEASFDALKFRRVVSVVQNCGRDVAILSGNDNFIYESMVLGADGCLIGFGTLASDIQVQMYEAVRIRDYESGERLAERLEPLIDAVFAPPIRNYRGRMKEALVMQGVLEHASVRPPLLPISRLELDGIRSGLTAAGLIPESIT